MSQNNRKEQETELLAAFRHPLRRELYREIRESKGSGISPRELATKLEEPLSNVSYHVRVLADAAAIECFKTVPVRGSQQHFYKVNPEVAKIEWVHAIARLGERTAA